MISVLIAAAVGAGLFATFANWKQVVKWLKDFVNALIGIFTTVAKGVAHAAGAFIEKVQEGVAAISHKLYYEEEGHYVEEVRVRQLPENELPSWAKRKLNVYQETDITEEVESELRMTL